MNIDKYFHLYGRKDDVVFEEIPAPEQRKTGKWIERKHGYWSFVNDKGERDGWIPSYECSECGSGGWRNPEVMNFCPNCGAKMEADKTNGAS